MHVCICVLHLLCRVSCSERQYGWHIVMCVISSHHFSTDGDLLEACESQFGCRVHSKKILLFTSRHVAATRSVPTFKFISSPSSIQNTRYPIVTTWKQDLRNSEQSKELLHRCKTWSTICSDYSLSGSTEYLMWHASHTWVWGFSASLLRRSSVTLHGAHRARLTGLESRLQLGHSRTLAAMSVSHSCVALALNIMLLPDMLSALPAFRLTILCSSAFLQL